MLIDLAELAPRDIYGFMTRSIVPRPVAWILTDNGVPDADPGRAFNLAPFSYFNGVCSRPPIISVSIGRKRDKEPKDTWRNIEEREHFVVHISNTRLAPLVSATAASLEFGDSEVAAHGIPLVNEADWPLPRVKGAPIALLCRRHQIIEVGDVRQGLVLGEIRAAFVADKVIKGEIAPGVPDIDLAKADPLARLGGNDFAGLGPAFTVQRPD